MALGLTGKISIGIAGAIGTLATGAGIYQLTKGPSTLGELLEEKGFRLIREKSTWNNLVQKHKETENEKIKKIRNLIFTSEGNSDNKNEEELKRICEELWNTKISSISKEEKEIRETEIKNWCVENPKALESS